MAPPGVRQGDSIADVHVGELDFTEVPTPPDGGYGWVIVFASFLCNMIVDGIAYSFGIFMPAFVEYFGEGVGKVAWVGSLLNGVYLSAGPIVSGLTNVYGCRPVTIAGGIMAGTAFLISTTVSSVSWLMLVYGVIGGLGFGLIYLPAIVTVNYYFESRRALATGIAVCGSGVGTFVFAPFASYMLGQYGWKGANMILAGIIFNAVVCGALMRPLVYKKPKASQKPLLQKMAEDKQRQLKRGSNVSDSFFFVQLPDGTLERRPKWKMNADPGVHSSLALNEFGSPSAALPTIAEAARTGGSSSPEEGAAEPRPSQPPPPPPPGSLAPAADRNGHCLPADAKDGPAAGEEQQAEKPAQEDPGDGGDAPARKDGPKANAKEGDNDSEKASDEEKNDVVPELPGEDLELGRRGSKKEVRTRAVKRRSSVPKGEPPAATNGAAMPKNVSTPSFGQQQRNPDLRRFSFHNRRGTGPSQEDLWLCSNTSVSAAGSRGSLPRPGEMLRPMSRRDIFYSGSIAHLAQYQSQRSLASYRASVLSLPRDGYADQQHDPNSWACVLPAGCGVLAEMIDMSLLRNPLFILICASNVFGMLGFYVPFVYIVDSAMMKGVEPDSAAFLLSVIGITNTLGRVISGFITDFPRVDALFVNNVCLMLSGVCIFLIPFCSSYASFVVVCVAFGFFVAGYISLTCIVLVDLLGIDKLSNSFGLLILFRGTASMVGPPVAGALFDYTGDYDVSFYAAGGLLLLASGISCLVPVARRVLERRGGGGGGGTGAAVGGSPSSPALPEVIVSDENDGSPEDAV
ncbi:monocarboxylate transporter 12-like [Pollicipes pollicipes]|uniref:monocarboxylate transporter 12-like n=1 Tax=Pollicipes pollicipes TaxID=41117 RepID=UPI001885740F|nr:monocarboxylate transporter 12-like [Pollicipes pollicipes]